LTGLFRDQESELCPEHPWTTKFKQACSVCKEKTRQSIIHTHTHIHGIIFE
jgi:hypothetical protein